jgi:SAM-dependent methyltransferase
MPTIPSAEGPFAELKPHQHRQVAESFGTDAERYDRTRPRYPEALIDRIVAAAPGPEVLDVGIGTGITARQFQAAGCTVTGIDPDPRMADFARRSGFPVTVSTFEAWDPGGRLFDSVIAGQAWHWVDPVAGAARAAQVLRPGGQLSVFWNAGQPPPAAAEAFATIYERLLPGSPMAPAYRLKSALEGYSTMAATAIDGVRQAGGLGEPSLWQFDWEHSYRRDEWLDLLPTQGLHTRLEPGVLDRLLGEIGVAVDALGGRLDMHYTALVVSAERVS